jgi:hypothetical protein
MNDWVELNGIEAVAHAKMEGWEIEEFYMGDWLPWMGRGWTTVNKYRGRPKQPKKTNVTVLMYFSPTGYAQFAIEGSKEDGVCKSIGWKRFPAGDITG